MNNEFRTKLADLSTSVRAKFAAASTVIMLVMVFGPMYVFAGDDSADWIKEAGGGELDGLNDTTKGYARDIYTLIMTIGAAVAVVCGIMAAISIMSGDARKRSEAKESLLYVFIGAALIGGMVAIISFMMKIGGQFTVS